MCDLAYVLLMESFDRERFAVLLGADITAWHEARDSFDAMLCASQHQTARQALLKRIGVA